MKVSKMKKNKSKQKNNRLFRYDINKELKKA